MSLTILPMYTLQKTMGRQIAQTAIMEEIDAGNIPLIQLSQHYYDVYFIIKMRVYDEPKVLFFNHLPLDIQTSYYTINQYLLLNDNKTIPVSDEIPTHIKGEVYAWDANSWNFDYHSTLLGVHKDAYVNEFQKHDLRITREGTNYHHASKYTMISINGLFHYHIADKDGWLVLDGNKTRQKNKNKTHINILDFTQIGEVELHRITRDMISPVNNNSKLRTGFYIDTKKSMIGYTVGICIGGYFHLLDHTYKRISERMLRINFNNINWESLFYKMKSLIDISSLPITDFGNDRVLGFELYHDDTIKALLEMKNSFLVFIKNPNVAVYEEPVGHLNIPKRYETGIPPVYPLRIGEGRYPAYKAIKNIDRWVLAVEDNIVPLQVRYQQPVDYVGMIHDRIYPINGETYASAHFVRIVSDRDYNTKELSPYFNAIGHDLGSLKPFALSSTENITYDGIYDATTGELLDTITKETLNNDYYSTTSFWDIFQKDH